MDDEQAKRLGDVLRARREALGFSLRQLKERCGIDDGLLSRMEQGQILTPSPDKLARLAEALDVRMADLYAMADYAVPSELPSFRPYLRTKYRSMPSPAIEEMERYFARLGKKYGWSAEGPAPGEDEVDDTEADDQTSRPSSRQRSGGPQKGGSDENKRGSTAESKKPGR